MLNILRNFFRQLFGGEGSPGVALFEAILLFIALPVIVLTFLTLNKKIKKLKASEANADNSEHSNMDPANIELFRAMKEQIRGKRTELTLINLIVGCAFFSVLAAFADKLSEYLNATGVISFDADSPYMRLLALALVAPLMIAIIVYAVWTFRNNAGKPEKKNKQNVRYSMYAVFMCTLILIAGIFVVSRDLL